jgi:putative ABC transport system permease protein
MDNLLRDIQLSLRLLIKNPGFSILASLALAVGIGGVATQSSIVYSVLFRGLKFENADRMMHIERRNVVNENQDRWQREVPLQDFKIIQERQTSFEYVGAYFSGTVNFTYNGNPYRVNGGRISGGFSDALKVSPFLGRSISPEDDKQGAPAVLLLSYGVWQDRFASNPNVVGSTIHINGRTGTVIGVMPEDFVFPLNEDVWIPLYQAQNPDLPRPEGFGVEVFGVLKEGVSQERATAEISTIMANIEQEFPQFNEGFSVAELKPFHREYIDDDTTIILWSMFVAVFLVLLVACANVANMLLARASVRSKELAIRTSLGASRKRVVNQLLTESIVLSLVGAFFGIIWAYFNVASVWRQANANQDIPAWMEFSIEPAVLAFVVLITVGSGLVAGVVPALKATKANVMELLKDDSRTGSSLHIGVFTKVLVAVQIAFSCILLVVAGLMMRGVSQIADADFGFDKDAALTARMGLFEGDYPEQSDRWIFMNNLLRNLEERPEIETAAMSSRYRFGWSGGSLIQAEEIDTDPENIPFHNIENVTWDYFKAMEIEPMAGRVFEEVDEANPGQVVVINERYAERVFPGQNPIGRRLTTRSGDERERQTGEDIQWRTIIGVVPDTRMQSLLNNQFQGGGVFVLMEEDRVDRFNTVILNGRSDPNQLAPILREEIRALDPNLPIYAVGTPRQIIDEDNGQMNFLAQTFATFGLISLFLGAIGIYGIMSFSVNQRTQEWGIRSAIGAKPKNILRLILSQGSRQAGIGLVAGLIFAYSVAVAMKQNMPGLMFDIPPEDPSTYIIVILILSIVSLLSCWIPAIRASRIHPMQALRHE